MATGDRTTCQIADKAACFGFMRRVSGGKMAGNSKGGNFFTNAGNGGG
jgi:hypothetical protein